MLNPTTHPADHQLVHCPPASRIVMSPHGAATTLQIIGDIRHVLRSACADRPSRAAYSDVGMIYALPQPCGTTHFALGGGAFGDPASLALQQLGEYALIEGRPWWTPARVPTDSRREAAGARMLTPFLIQWDRVGSAWASLNAAAPTSLLDWYDELLHDPHLDRTGAIAVEIFARTFASLIVDKHLRRAPLIRMDRVDSDHLITDPDLIDIYFQRNAVQRSLSADTVCDVVMVGVALDPDRLARAPGDVLRRGFYITPGVSVRARTIHHTHAVVLPGSRLPMEELIELGAPERELAAVADAMLAGARETYLVHLESDTRLSKAVARIGIIEEMIALAA